MCVVVRSWGGECALSRFSFFFLLFVAHADFVLKCLGLVTFFCLWL